MSKCISEKGAAIQAQQSATKSSSTVLAPSTANSKSTNSDKWALCQIHWHNMHVPYCIAIGDMTSQTLHRWHHASSHNSTHGSQPLRQYNTERQKFQIYHLLYYIICNTVNRSQEREANMHWHSLQVPINTCPCAFTDVYTHLATSVNAWLVMPFPHMQLRLPKVYVCITRIYIKMQPASLECLQLFRVNTVYELNSTRASTFWAPIPA